jgi:26S proteasome subunit RPN7
MHQRIPPQMTHPARSHSAPHPNVQNVSMHTQLIHTDARTSASLAMADDVLPIPNLNLPQHFFTLSTPSLAHLHDNARQELLRGGALSADQSVLEGMEKENKEELEKLDERLAEAEKTEGESEISDALKAGVNYFTRIGDKVA